MESEVYWLLVKYIPCGNEIYIDTIFSTLLVIERKIFFVTYDTDIKVLDVVRVRTQLKVVTMFGLGHS